MAKIAEYINGGFKVELFDEGTKVRTALWKSAEGKLPESIDLKITNYCDAGCQWCHEQSTVAGKHGDIKNICRVVEGLPAGVEIAIGGGNPLAHPELLQILNYFKSKGLISNITVNALHLHRFESLIKQLRSQGLIYGLGVSYHPKLVDAIKQIADDNTVIHMIAGVHEPWQVAPLINNKLLILGYKNFGFGKTYFSSSVQQGLKRWAFFIGSIMEQCHVSFDNLALKQLNIKEIISVDIWKKSYMGDDGKFTMYVDAVRNEFAISSTSDRKALIGMSAYEAFKKL